MRPQGKDITQEREEFAWTDMSMISETRNETECCDTVKTEYRMGKSLSAKVADRNIRCRKQNMIQNH